MHVELRSNGVIQIELKPETKIEHAFMREIAERTAKGEPVKVVAVPVDGSGSLILSMEK